MNSWLDVFVVFSPVAACIVGYLFGVATSRHQVIKREAARGDLTADVEPTEFSHGWRGRT
ncbi:hypothetical protein ACFPLB_04170 [Aquamicrobium segne]|uniref:Uncharacterized protein n=1 Tax=Aquamicrobium segne TaxID=469547 RepID=A0ABW0GU63_9HYPH